MHTTRRIATLAVAIALATITVPVFAAASTTSRERHATPTGPTLYALGSEATTFWGAVNNFNQVAGQSGGDAARWQSGKTTLFSPGGADAIDAAGDIFGNSVPNGSPTKYPALWSASGRLTQFSPLAAEPTGLQTASPNGNTAGYGVGGMFVALASSYKVQAVATTSGLATVAINDAGEAAFSNGYGPTNKPFLWKAGTSTQLKVSIGGSHAINAVGDVAGSLVGSSGAAIEHADGSLSALAPLHAGDHPYINALNVNDEAVGSENGTAVAWINGKSHTVASLIPASLGFTGTPITALDVNDWGSILFMAYPHGSNQLAYYLLAEPTGSALTGTALHGTDGTHLSAPRRAAKGVVVSVSGVSDTQTVVNDTTETNGAGGYRFSLPNGSYTVKVEPDVCIEGVKGCASTARVRIKGADEVVNLVAPTAKMAVTVTMRPAKLVLTSKNGQPVPAPVVVTVLVRNIGRQSFGAITMQPLLVSYFGNQTTTSVPLRPAGGPTPRTVPSLRPGAAAPVAYKLTAKAPGTFIIEALAITYQGGVRVVGVGKITYVIR